MQFFKIYILLYVAWVVITVLIRDYRGRRVISQTARERELIRALWQQGEHVPKVKVVLLLPMLREQSQVERLLDRLCRMEYPPENLVLVPITTELESLQRKRIIDASEALLADLAARRNGWKFMWKYSRFFPTSRLSELSKMDLKDVERVVEEQRNQPTTQTVIEQLLRAKSYRFPVLPVHYPHGQGNKASQMNYALDALKARGFFDEPERTYIGVYDADSRPSSLTLFSLSLSASVDPAPAFQQYPIYFNGESIPGKLMRNEAWMQTARSVCVEYPRQLEVNQGIERASITARTYAYCIGHGEFLRADWLLRTGFPERQIIDDIPTGVMMTLARQRIVPLPFFDFCSVPHGIFDFFRQTTSWFATQINSRDPIAMARKHFADVPKIRGLRVVIEQFIQNITWLMRGPLRLALLVAAVALRDWVSTLLLLSAWMIEAKILWAVTHRLLNTHEESGEIQRLPFQWSAITRNILKSGGPCLYLLRRLTGKTWQTYKTER